MVKYNYCPKCNSWLGWKSFFKFGTKNKSCLKCEEENL